MPQKEIKQDKKGYYYRNLGWKRSKTGERPTQPKFILGKDEEEARLRMRRLESLWKIVVEDHGDEYGEGIAQWDDLTLEVARAIGRGEHVFQLPRQYEPTLPVESDPSFSEHANWADADYSGYLRRIQDAYPVIAFIPCDEFTLENGVKKNLAVARSHQRMADSFARDAGHETVANTNETLHGALDAFAKWIEIAPKYQSHDDSPTAPPLTSWAYKLRSICLDFKTRFEDRPLSTLNTLESIQELYDFWRSRPKSRKSETPITVKTVKHRLTGLTQFLKWLHRTDKFNWRKPIDFGDIEHSANETRAEKSLKARPDQVLTYSKDELVSLYQSANSPLERVLMLLALNCGFKQAEIGTLMLGEVELRRRHEHAALLKIESCDEDSFVKRIRQKSSVYGEYKLWNHTVAGLEWLIERRRSQTVITSGRFCGTEIPMSRTSVLLTRNNGVPMYQIYTSGNPSQDIASVWNRLLKRTAKSKTGFRKLSYSVLRNSVANMLRRDFDSEIANLYLAHGTPFEKDKLLEEYSNRRFGRLFFALDKVGRELIPRFGSVTEAFPEIRETSKITEELIREIKRLLAQGMSKAEVAKRVGVHRSSVYRYE